MWRGVKVGEITLGVIEVVLQVVFLGTEILDADNIGILLEYPVKKPFSAALAIPSAQKLMILILPPVCPRANDTLWPTIMQYNGPCRAWGGGLQQALARRDRYVPRGHPRWLGSIASGFKMPALLG